MIMLTYNWKKILIGSLWILAGIGTIVLLGAAMQQKQQKHCAAIRIEISGAEQHMFIDEKDVMAMLAGNGHTAGKPIGGMNLRQMESLLEKNSWVKNAEMFLDNNQVLQVRIEERQPVARVFALNGSSFYVDGSALRLPLSEKLSAKVPVFTGFPSDRRLLAHPDSLLLGDIVKLGTYILADSFWMSQVAQVDITPQSHFCLVPVVGDHTIVFGNAEEIEKKFTKLYTFYKKAWLQNGINTYEKLDVQYDNQVVAIRKGIAKVWADSARAHQLMQDRPVLSAAADSATSGLKPVAIKPMAAAGSVVKTKSAVVKSNKTGNKPLSNGKKPAAKKTVTKKPAEKKQAKAVMGKGNEQER